MPIVVNATQENISIKIAGNWFNWKPGQERVIHNKSIAHFIQMDRTDSGLAVLPDLVADDEEVTPEQLEERKKTFAETKAQLIDQALDRYIKKHRDVIYNNQVSLRRDLEQANIKADPAVFASKGEMESMRLVAKYQKSSEDQEAAKIAEVNRLMKPVKGT